ncbi:hypothetical protein HK405_006330, partial [Cladochytrium tenue]
MPPPADAPRSTAAYHAAGPSLAAAAFSAATSRLGHFAMAAVALAAAYTLSAAAAAQSGDNTSDFIAPNASSSASLDAASGAEPNGGVVPAAAATADASLPGRTYAEFHLAFTLPPLAALMALWSPVLVLPCARPARTRMLFKLYGLCLVAFAYTTPWDSYIIRAGAWSYEPHRVIGTFLYIPFEEYSFFIIQSAACVLFTALVHRVSESLPDALLLGGVCTCPLPRGAIVEPSLAATCGSVPTQHQERHLSQPQRRNHEKPPDEGSDDGLEHEDAEDEGRPLLSRHNRRHAAFCKATLVRWVPVGVFSLQLAIGVVLVLLPHGSKPNPYLYLGAILGWTAPVLALTWWFGGPFIAMRPLAAVVSVLVPTVYLAYADHCAIADSVWIISPATSTGIMVTLSLPLEEFLFFLATNTMLVFGLRAVDRGFASVQVMLEMQAAASPTHGGSSSSRTAITRAAEIRWFASDLLAPSSLALMASAALLDEHAPALRTRQADAAVALAAMRAGSKSFSLALKLFPTEAQPDIVALYALCRVADDFADAEPDASDDTARSGMTPDERWAAICALRSIVAPLWDEKLGEKQRELQQQSDSDSKERKADLPASTVATEKSPVTDADAIDMDSEPELEDPVAQLCTRAAWTRAGMPASALDGPVDLTVVGAVLRNLARSRVPQCVPLSLLDELFSGFRWDLDKPARVVRKEADLQDYAARVASSVGESMLRLLWHLGGADGTRDNAPDDGIVKSSRDMGLALQYVNIARDILTDAELGRVYVPAEWFPAENGESRPASPSYSTELSAVMPRTLTRSALLALGTDSSAEPKPEVQAELSLLAGRMLGLVGELARSARRGAARLPPAYAAPVRAALAVYLAIGGVIEAAAPRYPRRAVPSKLSRVMVAAAELAGVGGDASA